MLKQKTLLLFIFLFLAIQGNAKIYAVIVGVSEYEDPSANLHFADDDALAYYNYMKSSEPDASLVMITDEDATKATILNYLKNYFLKASVDDQIIFFFSGHGAPGKFMCYDSPLKGNYLTHSEVKAAFKASKAKTKICIADACFSGSMKVTKEQYKKQNNTTELKAADNLEIIVFMSSQPWQTSQEKGNLGQGVFTYYIIEALKGNADTDGNNSISAKELYSFVRLRVMQSTENKQTPIMFGKFKPGVIIH